MQRRKDVIVRGTLAALLQRWSRAIRGRQHQRGVLAANSGTFSRTHILAVIVLAISVLACGDERPPWSGFPVFPPDASGFELSPELASSLRAAEVAFITQLAAEQGLTTPGAVTSSDASANAPDAGAPRPPLTAADTSMPAPAGEASKPSESGAAGRASAGARAPSEPQPQPAEPDAGSAVDAAAAGRAGAPPIPDGMMTAGAGGSSASVPSTSSPLDAGVALMNAGAGGQAGSTAPSNPPAPQQLDASTTIDAADGGP